jgi:hypothetical protein
MNNFIMDDAWIERMRSQSPTKEFKVLRWDTDVDTTGEYVIQLVIQGKDQESTVKYHMKNMLTAFMFAVYPHKWEGASLTAEYLDALIGKNITLFVREKNK